MHYLYFAVGSALGGMARYWCSTVFARSFGEAFPWGTIIVNVLGSLLIGIAFATLGQDARWQVPAQLRESFNLFFVVGLLGGFTTFSAFSLQTLVLIRDQQWMSAGFNILLSVGVCIGAAAVGYWAALR
jgi:CrcB protein